MNVAKERQEKSNIEMVTSSDVVLFSFKLIKILLTPIALTNFLKLGHVYQFEITTHMVFNIL